MIRIELHPAAPPQPKPGQPCNGCGVCCMVEPCPVAILFLWQRRGRGHGPCRALQWQETSRRYVCGMVVTPADYLRWLPRQWSPWAGRWFARKIAAGSSCDANIEVMETK